MSAGIKHGKNCECLRCQLDRDQPPVLRILRKNGEYGVTLKVQSVEKVNGHWVVNYIVLNSNTGVFIKSAWCFIEDW